MHNSNTTVILEQPEPALKRSISLTLVTLYGLGNILGAGIYVLIGKVAAIAGIFTPLSFLVASILAGLTAFSYAELSTRFPVSAGEAIYVQSGFNIKQLSSAVGLLIILAGIVSAATITRGFVGYFQAFFDFPSTLVTICLVVALCALAAWGIVESLRFAALLTLAEIFGLAMVVWVAFPNSDEFIAGFNAMSRPASLVHWHGILLGGILAFYAYIGFEDMVNVAEEVKNPKYNMPRAIIFALVLSTLLYMGVALVAITSGPITELANSNAPLAFIYQRATGSAPTVIGVIALFAVVNGALIQIIMASRVCYGMSRQGWLPPVLSRVEKTTGTPIIATVLVSLLLLIMALWLPVETLAQITSFLLLMVFALVNIALWRIKRRGDKHEDVFTIPIAVPIIASVMTLAFLVYQIVASAIN